VTDGTIVAGSVGLHSTGAAVAAFSDIRVDDFRAAAQPVYRFEFTTSRYATFFHHLHSYQDETWLAAVDATPPVLAALGAAVDASVPADDAEGRAYEALAAAVFGSAARSNPHNIEVTGSWSAAPPVPSCSPAPSPSTGCAPTSNCRKPRAFAPREHLPAMSRSPPPSSTRRLATFGRLNSSSAS
jgi:hypothetical protein